MTETRQPTMREYAIQSARGHYAAAMSVGKILHVELVADKQPAEHVNLYGARALKRGLVRVGVVYNSPDDDGRYYAGADLHPADAAHWLAVRGVPAVRLSARLPKM